jgi:uncharacterized RDD family membrane protein YckC
VTHVPVTVTRTRLADRLGGKNRCVQVCAQCGTPTADLVTFCPSCGARLGEVRGYGSFGRRLLAVLIDIPVLAAAGTAAFVFLAFTFGMVAGLLGTTDETDDRIIDAWVGPVMLGLLVVVPIAYSTLLEGTSAQGTVGKLALRLRVADDQGRPLSLRRAFGRSLAKLVTVVTCGLGYLPAAFSDRRQAVHDLVARTLVLGREA